ncbi:MAG: hypothetical protein AB8V25_03960, partial [Candidatus Midichloria sp.]
MVSQTRKVVPPVEIFCLINDFFASILTIHVSKILKQTRRGKRKRASMMTLSKIITILVLFDPLPNFQRFL